MVLESNNIYVNFSDFRNWSSFPYHCEVYRDVFGDLSVRYQCSDALFFKLLDLVWSSGFTDSVCYNRFRLIVSDIFRKHETYEGNSSVRSVYSDGLGFDLWSNPVDKFDGGVGLYYLFSETIISEILSDRFFDLNSFTVDSFWYLYEVFRIRSIISYLEGLASDCKKEFEALRYGLDSGVASSKLLSYYGLDNLSGYLTSVNEYNCLSLFGKDKDSVSYLIFVYGLKYCNLVSLLDSYRSKLSECGRNFDRFLYILQD